MSESPLWQPTPQSAAESNLTAFCRALQLPFADARDFSALHQWSIAHSENFWRGVWQRCGVIGTAGDTAFAPQEEMINSAFFPDARLNFAENLLEHDAPDNADALIGLSESSEREVLSWGELCTQANRLAVHFRSLGVEPGDRIAAALPNGIDAAVAMLACTKLGAVWSSCSPDFGVAAMVDRFGQIEPTLVLGCHSYSYGGKRFECREKMTAMVAQLQPVPKLLFAEPADSKDESPTLLGLRSTASATTDTPLPYVRLPFNSPLFIMFSSGTTGAPKCIVHGIGGTLLKLRSEHALHCDLDESHRLMFYTTCGWMMWNWLVGALAGGTTIVLYDGAPFHPATESLLNTATEERLTHLGVSPGYLSHIAKSAKQGKLRERWPKLGLTTLLSTGSPLPDNSFHWVSEQFGDQVQLSSISGGTDIMGCFALGNPWQGVYAGEIQGPALGMALAFYSDEGDALIGTKGELVCTQAFPSQPVSFWNDPQQAKYRSAYFERFTNIWHHGDYGEIGTHGGVRIHGRSDAVLNRGGVRIGTAEIYRQLEPIKDIAEAVVVGQQSASTDSADSRIVLFVRLQPGITLETELEKRIKDKIRQGTSPRHLPDVILQVQDIPRTRSGKIVELAITSVINGEEVKNTGALANPEALEEYRTFSDLT